MGIPLLKGEGFPDGNSIATTGGVAVVSQTLSRKHWPDENAVGKRIGFWECCDLEIVGVVGDVHDRGVDDAPFNAPVDPKSVVYTRRMGGSLLVRTMQNPLDLIPIIRDAYSDLLSGFVLEFDTLAGLHSKSLARPRFHLLLVGVFAVIALILAIIGLYGVVAHMVSQRTREVGVRMALGADRSNVQAMVVRQAMRPVVFGVVAGVAGALALSRAISTMLYGMDAVDPTMYAGVVAILVAAAACASCLPARRASSVDPVLALRTE
jgi:ABC-type antimicrobial peptide transport system permease subunit